jgi:hypothetical protein
MKFLTRWTIAAAVCVLISWAAVDDSPDEVESAQATQDWINDTAAQLVAARRGE